MYQTTYTLPDFLIIGAPKSGTWWLASRVAKHPRVFLARGAQSGEVKYFTKYFHKPLSYYSSLFEASGERIKGEKSPHYCTLPESRIRFVAELMPTVRLILILRNPIDRDWSETLNALLRNTGKRYEQLEEATMFAMLDKVRIKYTTVIKNWFQHFSQDQLHICFFDDIKNDPRSLLENVFRHIGVSEDIDYSQLKLAEVVNKGMEIPLYSPYMEYLRDVYASEVERMHQMFGDKIDPWRSPMSTA